MKGTHKHLKINEISMETAVLSAQLRAKHSLKTPDALQIASALEHLADFFLTNDKRLKNLEEINVIVLEDEK